MSTIQLSSDSFLITDSGSAFIPLGAELSTNEEREQFRDKIRGFGPKHPKIWGTLGRAENDSNIGWSGRLSFSKSGNLESEGITLDEIRDIYDINPAVNSDTTRVIERFVNMDDITFPEMPDVFTHEDIPNVRLTLFLDPDEGAMAYYHHFTDNWRKEGYSEIEYILPEPTPEHSTNRDRLTYKFPILPDREILNNVDGSLKLGSPRKSSFVIKILVFKRQPTENDSYAIVQKGIERVRTEKRYKILRYDPDSNTFIKPDPINHGLQSDVKTLLFFHGTFSSTEGSFGGLLGTKQATNSWLKVQSQIYPQIIGFDHSTIMHDAEENILRFRDMMQGVHFQHVPLDIITFSRGGLVGKQLACGPGNDAFPIRKAALVTCANGVGYFTAARYLGIFLRYIKTSTTIASGGMGAIISLFAQHSGKFFLSRPGAQQMTIGNSRLDAILRATPAPQNANIEFKAISGKWTKRVARESRLLSRLAQHGIGLLTRPILGNPNDFVVNTGRQQILPVGYETNPKTLLCTHTTFFTGRLSADKIRDDFVEWFG